MEKAAREVKFEEIARLRCRAVFLPERCRGVLLRDVYLSRGVEDLRVLSPFLDLFSGLCFSD